MIGLNALLSTQGRMLAEEIPGNTITVVFLALIFARALVGEGICVNMLMVCLSAGYTPLSTGLGFARMAQVVQGGFVFLPTQLKSFDPCMSILVLQFHLLDHLP